MKSVVVLLIILFSIVIFGQPQLENDIANDFRDVGALAKQIVIWFFLILIVIFSVSATVMNLSRGKKKNNQIEP